MTIQPADDAMRGLMFAARHLSEQDRWDEAGRLIREIVALERATHPSGGAETQNGKEAKAQKALNLAGQLVRVVAGWAIDHVAGVAAEATSAAERIPSDDHRHESRGWSIQVDDGNAETVGRAVLKQLVACNPGAFPQSVQRTVVASLESLDYGETLSLLAPTKINRHQRLRSLRHQVKALQHAEYRSHLPGASKGRAREIVADAYGISPSTLRTAWGTRAPKELPVGEVEQALADAREYATARVAYLPDDWPDYIARTFSNGETVYEPDLYSDAALRADAQAYHQHLASEQRSPQRPRQVLRRLRDT